MTHSDRRREQFRNCVAVTVMVAATFLATLAQSTPRPVVREAPAAAAMLRRFADKDQVAVASGLASVEDWEAFARDLREAARSFPSRIVATFGLEAAEAHQRSVFQEVGELDYPRNELLDAAWDRLSPDDLRSPYGLAWILAASSLLQGTGAEGPFLTLRHRAMRFPIIDRLQDVGRAHPNAREIAVSRALILTREVHRDAAQGEFSLGGITYRQGLGPLGGSGAIMPDRFLREALSVLRPLTTGPQASDLARLHYAFFLQLRGAKPDAASRAESDRLLAQIAEGTQDSWIRYMARLLSGRAAVVANRADAASLLRLALELRPGAVSASRLLAGLLYARGDRPGAVALLASMNKSADDPWLIFPYGEFHLWPERLAGVRALTW